MYIKKSVFEKLLSSCPDCPPETGGVLGGQGERITHFVLDKVSTVQRGDFYVPNTEYLNSVIAQWHAESIRFLGVFHTHPQNAKTLSNADCAYIKAIMQSLPVSVHRLYFPIVIPNTQIYAFSACLKNGQIDIQSEPTVRIE